MPFTLPASLFLCRHSGELVKDPVLYHGFLYDRGSIDEKIASTTFEYPFAKRLLKQLNDQPPETSSETSKERRITVDIHDFMDPCTHRLFTVPIMSKEGIFFEGTNPPYDKSNFVYNYHYQYMLDHLIFQFRHALVDETTNQLTTNPILFASLMASSDTEGLSHLHWAAKCLDHVLLITLIEKYQFPIDIRDRNNNTPLMLVASYSPDDVDIDSANSDSDDDSTLPDIEMAEYLLSKGANIHAQNTQRYTPFICASLYGTIPMMELLIDHTKGACFTERYPVDSDQHKMPHHKKQNVLTIIFSDKYQHIETENFQYLLQQSKEHYHIHNRVDNNEANTLLLLEASKEPDECNEEIIQILIEEARHSSFLLHQNHQGDTIFHLLSKMNYTKNLKQALLKYSDLVKAQLFLKNDEYQTPYDVATTCGHYHCLSILYNFFKPPKETFQSRGSFDSDDKPVSTRPFKRSRSV